MTSTKGTIKRLVVDKGFGFVADHDGGEYFFHHSACQGTRFDELRAGPAGDVSATSWTEGTTCRARDCRLREAPLRDSSAVAGSRAAAVSWRFMSGRVYRMC
jgi:cold shock protein